VEDQDVKYLLRIDKNLKQYLAREARLNERSLNKEIIFRLRSSKSPEQAGTSIWEQARAKSVP
jgi:ribonuclease D